MAEPEHLSMIQAIVTRLSANSAQMKRWTVTLTAALLGLAADRQDRRFALVALYVLIALAALDAYYLALERRYRTLYSEVVGGWRPDWFLTAGPVGVREVFSAATSLSVWLLHGLSAAAVVAVLLSV